MWGCAKYVDPCANVIRIRSKTLANSKSLKVAILEKFASVGYWEFEKVSSENYCMNEMTIEFE